jgi:hypothetical protein
MAFPAPYFLRSDQSGFWPYVGRPSAAQGLSSFLLLVHKPLLLLLVLVQQPNLVTCIYTYTTHNSIFLFRRTYTQTIDYALSVLFLFFFSFLSFLSSFFLLVHRLPFIPFSPILRFYTKQDLSLAYMTVSFFLSFSPFISVLFLSLSWFWMLRMRMYLFVCSRPLVHECTRGYCFSKINRSRILVSMMFLVCDPIGHK